ncbi:E4 SUMO-protein ligase PIAL2 isoform X1 [Vitis vinifera]|uniref:SP-RING-type domain-containing protein n=3 Tax=Vitis vinifera TaxID=29760 RepID=F6I651_VITVI|nr:E4 SUMO-protein ligase PIAL2 isoform X1 [Vitis vinifera]XP_010661814.1 E4 SUMO-protein ligase PIAL2 isoform X1 [Vitis vinifera]XP_010661817.1 E4 SUMO-protein ligase PIAL2 isoform X1 [Vitis vinifera]XP_019081219.1 E4 SUMO-protein ligase PIAL2 isoform X1 [Vitis vinifera]XP_019081220.1 E4 SUMO-protein ligase PIAL2 isoform X1 [Vitis vinifera]XP_019081222.1 E4 SUMO-protein ligase PIAL2 isoform X1 [Vitis vinifera]XP_019081223.1 E4 SUMO-protein ligase PIAL2 isoform X1 [Vitis vinifera]XP_05959893|eukprot:XP_010661811.1 PREDICTED: E4 SUMO-protein ligase PIAL2 isoform X1 [Vitis vinifera]
MAGESRMNMAITGSVGGGGHVSLLVASVADLLEMHIQSGQLLDSAEFSNLCLSLARGIDYAVANNEIPVRARDLPLLLKQVLRCMNDSSLLAVFVVLMISVKNACKIGWFPDHDANDLLALAKEIGKNFSTMEDINVQPSYLLNVWKIMLRYYPRFRMGHMLASLDVKPGYGAFVVDFHITKSMLSPAQKRICLFVAQTDNMDTSSCIVLPPQANFMLNGQGVRGRINGSMDNGPQLPTNVTAMLKYGKNLLQVVGQFNGNYVIVIAFMSMISTSNTPELQDYIQPVAVTPDSDLEVIEGQARISLNCPISFKRIKIPVKGHLCKHHQCFDYGNFMEINSRRPSWRCPHCNQPVCNPDIRIDQKMVKVLKEVEENVVDVIISPDGSWKPVVESIDHETQSNQQEHSEQCESVGFSNIPAQVVDLTMGEDDEDECLSSLGTEDVKPLSYNLQGSSAAENFLPPGVNYMVEADQSGSSQTEDHVWSAEQFPPSVSNGFVLPTMSSNGQRNFGVSRTPSSFMSSHVLTDAISPSLWETLGVHRETQMPISSLQNQYFRAGNTEIQQTRFGSLSTSNEYRMVCLPNLGATQVIKSRNIVHPSIRIQPGQVQQRRSSVQVTGAAGQERAQMSSMPPSVPVQLQPARTGTRFSYAMVAEQLRTAAEEERRNMMGRTGMAVEQLGTAWSSPGADALAENWQPPGTMRGSLTGEADSAAISQFMLQPPTSLTATLESGLPAFWPFPSSSTDHNAMYSQTETQGRLRSNWAGTGSSGGLPEWTPWIP